MYRPGYQNPSTNTCARRLKITQEQQEDEEKEDEKEEVVVVVV